jgi:IS5 family transposase
MKTYPRGPRLPPHKRKSVRGAPRLGRAAAPDESIILNFRHLLEKHDLCGKIFDTVNLYLNSKGIRITTGTIVDAASVHDKHMLSDLLHGDEKKVCHPTDEGLSVGTPVWSDAGYQGQTEAVHKAASKAQDMTNRRVKTKHGVDEDGKRRNRTK